MKKLMMAFLVAAAVLASGFAQAETFAKDNFNKEHDLWNVTATGGTVSFAHGAKRFAKSATGWNTLGQVFATSHTLQVGDTFELKFIPQSYTAGNPNTCGACTFWQAGILLDSPTLRASGYGLYAQADGFFAIGYATVPVSDSLPIEAGETYVLTLEVLANSNLNISIKKHGDAETLLQEFPGPFIGRTAWFYQDFYSVDTVDLVDFTGSN